VLSIHRQIRLHISRSLGGILLVLFSICFFLWDMVLTSPIVVQDLNIHATILVEKIPQLNELKPIKFSLIRRFVPRCTHFCTVAVLRGVTTVSNSCTVAVLRGVTTVSNSYSRLLEVFKTFRRRYFFVFSIFHHIWVCIWVNLMFLVLINVCTV